MKARMPGGAAIFGTGTRASTLGLSVGAGHRGPVLVYGPNQRREGSGLPVAENCL